MSMVNRKLGRWWLALLVVCGGVLLILAVPYVASAFHLEVAGCMLDTPSSALAHLQEALHWQPTNAQAHRLLAQVYRQQGEWSAAAEAQERYTQLRPANPLGHMELAEIYESVEAESGSMKSTEFGTLAQGEAWELGRTLPQTLQIEEWRKAGMGYEDLIARGVASQGEEQYAEALSWFRRASQLEPNLADAWYHTGQVYEDQKLWGQALDAYQKANRSGDFHQVGRSNPHFRTGVIYLRLVEDPQPAKAEIALREALAKADFGSIREAAWAHARLGQVYYDRDGDPSAAESEMLNALKLAPEDKWLWVILGNLYSEENRNTEAASMYERALALDPDFEGAQKRLDAVRRE